MLRYRRPRHRQSRREQIDRARAAAKPFKYFSPRRVREYREGVSVSHD
jgi:hypothetical protein